MGIEATARLIYPLLRIDKYKLLRCQKARYCGVTRDFRVIFHQNCAERKGGRLANYFSNFTTTQAVGIFVKRIIIQSPNLSYVKKKTILLLSKAHNESIFFKCNQLITKYSLLLWTLVPLHIFLWSTLTFPTNITDSVYNRLLQFGQCETVGTVLPPIDHSVVPLVSGKDNHSRVYALFCSLTESFHLSLRAIYLLCVFSPLFLAYPLTYASSRCFTVWLHLLFIAVEYSGATFVKLGQWASTRRDLFSKEFCDLFSGLHHRVRPHGWSHTAKTLKQAYGNNWQQILHLSDKQEPVGSGCIAQVYKGHLSTEFVPPAILCAMEWDRDQVHSQTGIEACTDDAGKHEGDGSRDDEKVIPVAIKVLHPKITETFQRDLKLMKAASKILTFLFPRLHWVNLNQCVEEFSVTMNKQLDMRYEFQCLERFTQDFLSFTNIKVPQPIPDFVRHNVLVETFEEGISVSHILRSTDHSVEVKEELASLGIDMLLQMVFVNNFVHADLHPGNLLVQNIDKFEAKKNELPLLDVFDTMVVDISPDNESSLKLVLLDCGITASLSPDDRQKFRDVFTAVVTGDGETVAELFLSKSPINKCTNPELFKGEMTELVANGCQKLMSLSKIKVAELMNDLFVVLSRHKIQLDSSFATIVLAIAMLEGLGRTLDPNLNLMDRARPVLLGGYLRK